MASCLRFHLVKQAAYTTGRFMRTARCVLLDFCAAALNEKKQHNYKKHAANYSNNRYVVHVDPPFCLLGKILLERLCHDDRFRANSHHEKRGEDKEDQREDQLDTGLCRLLFYLLPPFRS